MNGDGFLSLFPQPARDLWEFPSVKLFYAKNELEIRHNGAKIAVTGVCQPWVKVPTANLHLGLRTMHKRAFQICLLWGALPFLLPCVAEAQLAYTNSDGGIYYYSANADGVSATITGYSGPPLTATIPSKINTLTVTSIGTNAFKFTGVTSATIPGSVTNIEYRAFYYCSGLTNVLIPGGVVNIGDEVFQNCTSLNRVTIPGSVISIGESGFDGCSSLTNVEIGDGVTSLGQSAFYGCSFASVVIPESVTSLGSYAFAWCTNLASITIPGSVTNIGAWVFISCADLTNATIECPGLGMGDFYRCPNLASVYFTGNAPSVDSSVFSGDAGVTGYSVPGTSGWDSFTADTGVPVIMLNEPDPNGSLQVTILPQGLTNRAYGAYWQVDGGIPQPGGATVLGLTVGSHTVSFSSITGWMGPSNLTVYVSAGTRANATGQYTEELSFEFPCITNSDSTLTITGYNGLGGAVTIPPSINGQMVEGIGSLAFSQIKSITSVTIPDGVATIGTNAFASCVNLTNATMGNGVTKIESHAFYQCQALTNFAIPPGVTSIESGAFAFCNAFSSVAIPKGTTNIGPFAFAYCQNLTNVTIPEGVTGIAVNAFENCLVLGSVTVPGNIAFGAVFAGCGRLTNAVIASGTTTISSNAFANCSTLTAITIPPSVTNIESAGLAYCIHLAQAYFIGNAPTLGSSVFGSDSRLTIYYLPGTTEWSSTFGGRPAVLWNPLIQTGSVGLSAQTGQFGFSIIGTNDFTVVVEVNTNLVGAAWEPLQTVTLTNGSFYFSDPQWKNDECRFYGLGLP